MNKWIYLAGLVDADGSISGSVHSQKFSCGVSKTTVKLIVVNTDKELMEWLEQTFGGKVYWREPPKKEWTERGEWHVMKKSRLKCVLERIEPFLKVKREQAKLVLDFLNYVKSTEALSKRWAKRRVEIVERLQELNKRGVSF